MKKIAIIGAGPAGISAALYAKRANANVTIYDGEQSALRKGHLIENYYGFTVISGEELYQRGIDQITRLHIPLYREEVTSLMLKEAGFSLTSTKRKEHYDAIILATGAYRQSAKIKGCKELETKGVSYCAMCDGFFFRGKKVAVIGNGEYALHEAKYLQAIVDELTIFTNGREFSSSVSFPLITSKIQEIIGEERVEALVCENGKRYEVDGIFIAEGSAGAIDFAKKLGLLIHGNKLEVEANMSTNIPGIYACGDCTAGLQQIAKAVYEGALAATSACQYLRKNG